MNELDRPGSGSTARREKTKSRPVIPALLQLLGWIGFLGIGYMVRGRILVGLAMLVGWWAAFWFLFIASIVTFGAFGVLMHVVWLVVPPLTACFLYADAG